MDLAGWSKRFLTGTRGEIVAMLRWGERTVGEMTVNALRAHLVALERLEIAASTETPG